jgi:hypothetical protein
VVIATVAECSSRSQLVSATVNTGDIWAAFRITATGSDRDAHNSAPRGSRSEAREPPLLGRGDYVADSCTVFVAAASGASGVVLNLLPHTTTDAPPTTTQ